MLRNLSGFGQLWTVRFLKNLVEWARIVSGPIWDSSKYPRLEILFWNFILDGWKYTIVEIGISHKICTLIVLCKPTKI